MDRPKVAAIKITPTQILYECANCYTDKRGRKKSTMYMPKGAKRTIHRHGNDRGDVNGFTQKVSHCEYEPKPYVWIEITNETEKLGF